MKINDLNIQLKGTKNESEKNWDFIPLTDNIFRLFQMCYHHAWSNFIVVYFCGLPMIGLKLNDKTGADKRVEHGLSSTFVDTQLILSLKMK